MRFTKMHGCGNDFVVLDAIATPDLEALDLSSIARTVARRTEGVGCDQMLVVATPTRPDAHVRMRVFNADGSEAGMCGNGIRCVTRYFVERHGAAAPAIHVEVGGVVRPVSPLYEAGRFVAATANLGPPELGLDRLPVDQTRLLRVGPGHEHLLDVDGQAYPIVVIALGNPHAVLFRTEAVPDDLLCAVGSAVERHPAFPQRMNVQLARAIEPDVVELRTWERGTGVTRACGTGACAALVAGVLLDRLGRVARVHMAGGQLDVAWDGASGDLLMTGPAEFVYDGDWPG